MLECIENAIEHLKLMCFIIIFCRRKGSILSWKIVSCMKFNPFLKTHFLSYQHCLCIFSINWWRRVMVDDYFKPIQSWTIPNYGESVSQGCILCFEQKIFINLNYGLVQDMTPVSLKPHLLCFVSVQSGDCGGDTRSRNITTFHASSQGFPARVGSQFYSSLTKPTQNGRTQVHTTIS